MAQQAQDLRDGPVEFAGAVIIQAALIYLTFQGASALGLGDELVFLVTAVMGCFSWFVSCTVKRVLGLRDRQPVRGAVAGVLGGIFLLMEAGVTHIGLDYLAAKSGEPLFPLWTLWPASIGLSLANMMVKWAFIGRARGPVRAKEKKVPRKLPASRPALRSVS